MPLKVGPDDRLNTIPTPVGASAGRHPASFLPQTSYDEPTGCAG